MTFFLSRCRCDSQPAACLATKHRLQYRLAQLRHECNFAMNTDRNFRVPTTTLSIPSLGATLPCACPQLTAMASSPSNSQHPPSNLQACSTLNNPKILTIVPRVRSIRSRNSGHSKDQEDFRATSKADEIIVSVVFSFTDCPVPSLALCSWLQRKELFCHDKSWPRVIPQIRIQY